MRRVLLVALLIDIVMGDPPNRWHPVAWMGRAIGAAQRRAPGRGLVLPLLAGGGIAWGGALVIWTLATVTMRGLRRVPGGWLLAALLLKATFSVRGLGQAAASVEAAIKQGDLHEARRLLSWHLVSRDTSELNLSDCAAAAVESVAENTSDGVIAPLCWYLAGGVPAAYAYRWVQTCDSMLGYRDARREWLGKIPARTDDTLNLLPARLTALLFIIVSGHPLRTWRAWRRDACHTASPNAGHPMSATAGALDIELAKADHYTLNAGARSPAAGDIRRARRQLWRTVALFVVVAVPVLGRRHD